MKQEIKESEREITAKLVPDYGAARIAKRTCDRLDPEQQLLLDLAFATDFESRRFATLMERASKRVRGSARESYRMLAESVSVGRPPAEAVVECPLLPSWCRVGLEQVFSSSVRSRLGRIWERQVSLPTTSLEPAAAVRSRSSQLFLMLAKLNFVLYVFSFILLYLVPEFRAMFEEFEVELTDSAIWMIRYSVPITMVASLLSAGLLLGAILGSILMPWLVSGWLNRWTPFRWNLDPLPRKAQSWQALGWWNWARLFAGRRGESEHHSAQPSYLAALPKLARQVIQNADRRTDGQPEIDWDDQVWADACGRANADALAGLGTNQARSWAMLDKAKRVEKRSHKRLSRLLHAIDVVIQIGIGLLVGLCAVAIFSLLVKLIEEV